MYKRILLKISGEALSSENSPLCQKTIDQTVENISELYKSGIQIGIVCGGGNILRGRSSGQMERNRADHMGMMATAINALALQDAFERIDIPATVLSAVDMPVFCDRYTYRDANRLLNNNHIVIFACGTGCPFFSTDTGAALRAAEIKADALLLAKNVDGVYSADPNIDPNAKKYSRLTYDKVIADNLKATDITAITLCRDRKMPIRVFALDEIKNLLTDNDDFGTTIEE